MENKKKKQNIKWIKRMWGNNDGLQFEKIIHFPLKYSINNSSS